MRKIHFLFFVWFVFSFTIAAATASPICKRMIPTIEAVSQRNLENRKSLEQVLNAPKRKRVVISSMSLGSEHIKDILGIEHYDIRLLADVLEARSSDTQVVFVSSLPIEPAIKDYVLSFLPTDRIPSVQFLDVASFGEKVNVDRPLAQAISESPEVISRLKEMVGETPSYLSVFIGSRFEENISRQLNIPVLAADSKLEALTTKTGNRLVFQEIKVEGIEIIPGTENIKSVDELISSLVRFWQQFPEGGKFVLKHDIGVSGLGNANMRLPDISHRNLSRSERIQLIEEALMNLTPEHKGLSHIQFLTRFEKGGVFEKFIDGDIKNSPSVQLRIAPNGEIKVLSTHEQILGGTSGQTFVGGIFPAQQWYRQALQEHGVKVAQKLYERGIIGSIAIDYLAVAQSRSPENFILYPVEINIRQGGMSHPNQWARLSTGSTYDRATGELKTPDGKSIHYRSSDKVESEALKGWTGQQVLAALQELGILLQPGQQTGVSPHLLSATYEYGKFGFTALATDPQTAKSLYNKVYEWVESLEKQSTGGKPSEESSMFPKDLTVEEFRRF